MLGRPIGDGIARSFAWLLGSPSGARIARASTCYPYYHTWKHLLCSGEKVRPMMPQCPLMFLHGTAGVKKVMVSYSLVFVFVPGGGSCGGGGKGRGKMLCIAVRFDDETRLHVVL